MVEVAKQERGEGVEHLKEVVVGLMLEEVAVVQD